MSFLRGIRNPLAAPKPESSEPEVLERGRYGLDLKTGDKHFESGQDVDTPYLRPGHYFGIEPERWLVEEGMERELGRGILEAKRPSFRFVADSSLEGFGTEFDFVVAQSMFSHTFPDLLRLGLRNIAGSLTPPANYSPCGTRPLLARRGDRG